MAGSSWSGVVDSSPSGPEASNDNSGNWLEDRIDRMPTTLLVRNQDKAFAYANIVMGDYV